MFFQKINLVYLPVHKLIKRDNIFEPYPYNPPKLILLKYDQNDCKL